MRKLKNLTIILTVLVDIYILGIMDLFHPLIYGVLFVIINYIVYYSCCKKSRAYNDKTE